MLVDCTTGDAGRVRTLFPTRLREAWGRRARGEDVDGIPEVVAVEGLAWIWGVAAPAGVLKQATEALPELSRLELKEAADALPELSPLEHERTAHAYRAKRAGARVEDLCWLGGPTTRQGWQFRLAKLGGPVRRPLALSDVELMRWYRRTKGLSRPAAMVEAQRIGGLARPPSVGRYAPWRSRAEQLLVEERGRR